MIDVSTLVGSVIGGVVASIIAIVIWEWYRQPNLVIEIPNKISGTEPAIQPQFPRAFYHLRAANKGKTPAYNCRITMKFKDVNTEKQLFTVNGKWDRGPQPLLYMPFPKQLLPNGEIKGNIEEVAHDFLVPFAEVIDIYPNTSESFCIVVKYDNEDYCYAFSSWSYLKGIGHKVDNWKLNIGEYIVEIELTYSGKKFIEKVYLRNPDKTMMNVEIKKP